MKHGVAWVAAIGDGGVWIANRVVSGIFSTGICHESIRKKGGRRITPPLTDLEIPSHIIRNDTFNSVWNNNLRILFAFAFALGVQ